MMETLDEDKIAITLQLEPWEEKDASYISLSRNDLAYLSMILRNLLVSTNVRAKDRILIYDYNTSLSTLVMSRIFSPGLVEGVCETMDCLAICTDGLSELAARSAYVFTQWKPDILMIRSDLIAPFRSNLKLPDLKGSDPNLRVVLVLHNDIAPLPKNIQIGPGDFDRYLLYKFDPALFMCIIKPCGGLRYPEQFYSINCTNGQEIAHEHSPQGKLAVHPNFSKKHQTFVSALECVGLPGMCYCGEKHEFRTEKLAL